MKRFRSIDILRGVCIFYMTFGHMVNWWISQADFWLYELIWNYGAPIGGAGFLLVSGMSASISYKKDLLKAQNFQEFKMNKARNIYMLRTLIIFLISTLWNFIGTLFMGLPGVWLWFVIQTISISLFMAWVFLKTSRIFRIFLCFAFWISNQIILYWLTPFRYEQNILGYLFYFLYNSPDQNVILGYFPYLLLGTVLGDLFFELGNIEDFEKKHAFIKSKVLIPSGIYGSLLISFGLLYKFPDFSNKASFSSQMFIVGIQLIFLALLVYFKDFRVLKLQKRFRFFEIFSYYSFTIFLTHHILYFLFQPFFNVVNIWFIIIPILIIWTYIFRLIYKKWDKYASIKFLINKFAVSLAERIESVNNAK
ncbi:MAG: acyltransferase family protein [Candidatus Lokiarchaeota archaeon]|nr:acyltransferase family protein [Candidatus Lokiarchaeota archaeon]